MSGNWKSSLNVEQARAAGHDAGPLIVLAGPGTGKTRVIIARVTRLIEEGAEPESILALAYNRKAAAELRSRLAEAVGASVAGSIQASTFHAFGSGLISRFGDWIGVRGDRSIMDTSLQRRMLRRLIFEHRLYDYLAASGREGGIDVGKKFIEACRHTARTPRDAARFAAEWAERVAANEAGLSGDALVAERQALAEFTDSARLFAMFEAECLQQGLMTYEDCLTLPLKIFTEKPDTAAILRNEIRHIVVDEFQDQNRTQIELLRHLAPPETNPDLCVVGDDDQAIYGFRGADPRAFAHFAEIWARHDQVELVTNYRSGRVIVAASNAVIARCDSRFAPGKRIEPDRGFKWGEGVVQGVILEDDAHHGAVIASMIALDRTANPGKSFGSYAVIARQHDVLEVIASELTRIGIPASRDVDDSIEQETGVQDLLSWVNVLTEPEGAPADVQRLLVRPPYFVSSQKVREWRAAFERERSFAEGKPGRSFIEWLRAANTGESAVQRFLSALDELRDHAVKERAERVIFEIIRIADLARSEELDGRARAQRISALVRVLKYARSRQRFLEAPGDLAAFARYDADRDPKEKRFGEPGEDPLDAGDEDGKPAPDVVRLMTAHGAKGLEFETVFLAKCRPRGFPRAESKESNDLSGVLPREFSGHEGIEGADEQRRLFYVACTRAERRLVLLAKKKGTSSTTTDYFNELTQQTAGLVVPVHRAEEFLDAAGMKAGDDVPVDLGGVGYRREAAVREEMAAVRRDAYAALHDAASDAEGAMLESARARLADAAGALHALERLRTGGSLPGDVPAAYRARLASVAERIAREQPAGAPARGMTPPFSLSYSQINLYEQCPACFYLRHIARLPEEESDALNFGNMMHRVLERFYGEVRDADANGRPRPGEARLLAVCETTLRESWPASRPFDSTVLDQALAQLRLAMRSLDDASRNILEIERSARFQYADPDTPELMHTIHAKIDRIDQSADGGLVMVDYKSGRGSIPLRKPKPDDLQFCIYAMALPSIFGESGQDLHGFAEYWLLSEGVRGRIALEDLDLAKARSRIDAAIRGMLAGRFERGKGCKKDCATLGMEMAP